MASRLYNFKLYENWCKAAEILGLELTDQKNNGACIYMELPKHIQSQFFWMLWTPLNKMPGVVEDATQDWREAIEKGLRHNIDDFHIEASKYTATGESHYMWFPEINCKPQSDITVDDIVKCIKRMLDEPNYEREALMATLRTEA